MWRPGSRFLASVSERFILEEMMKVTGERFVPGKMFKHSEIEHMHRYSVLKTVLKDKIVLDAACGTGYGSNIIASVAKEVYGIDISQEAIEYANSTFTECRNLKYIKADISKLPFENETFDIVVSFETIEHVDADIQNKFLREIKRVLKPDGMLIMSTPNKEIYTVQTGNQPTEWHVKEFFEDEFDQFLKNEFKNIRYYQQYISKASYLLNSNTDTARLINDDKEKRGKFIVAVANNGDNSNTNLIQLNSIYYYPDEYAEMDEICQVFYSAAGESDFTEVKSEIVEISSKQKEICIEIEFEDSEAIKKIRVDPLNNSCCIENINVEIWSVNQGRISPKTFINNADEIINNSYYFYHRDPQYIMEFMDSLHIEKLIISFSLKQYNLDSYSYLINKVKGISDMLKKEKAQISTERSMIEEQNIFYNSAQQSINREREAINAERNSIIKEREAIAKEREAITEERKFMLAEKGFMEKERTIFSEEKKIFNEKKQNFLNKSLAQRVIYAITKKSERI